jgi:hypothetical protein
LSADLGKHFRTKHFKDSVKSLDWVGSVEGGKHKVPRLCRLQGDLNRFLVSEFGDGNDIGVLA